MDLFSERSLRKKTMKNKREKTIQKKIDLVATLNLNRKRIGRIFILLQ